MEKPLRFIVIALVGSVGEKWHGCRIVPEGSFYPMIYTQVFGPASRPACEDWIAENCHPVAAAGPTVVSELGFEIHRYEATGYSSSFSFDEAFQDAIENLPLDPDPGPDKLYEYRVECIGAQVGGFPGFNRMYVTVSVVY
jgi:hypothetical protein